MPTLAWIAAFCVAAGAVLWLGNRICIFFERRDDRHLNDHWTARNRPRRRGGP